MTDPLPRGACDCHAHVFGPAARFPYAEPRSYTPHDAPLGAYLAHLDRLGCERGVLVQPSAYGRDNRAMLDALAQTSRSEGVPDNLAHKRLEAWMCHPESAKRSSLFGECHRRGWSISWMPFEPASMRRRRRRHPAGKLGGLLKRKPAKSESAQLALRA